MSESEQKIGVENQVSVQAIAYPSGAREGAWIVQFLEFDMVTQCRRTEDISGEIRRFLEVYIEGALVCGIVPFANVPAAPERFWRAAKGGADRALFTTRSGWRVDTALSILAAKMVHYPISGKGARR